MNLKTSLIVFYIVLFSAMLVIYLYVIGLQWKELFIKVQLGAFKVALLTLPTTFLDSNIRGDFKVCKTKAKSPL